MHHDPDRSWITDRDPDHPKGTRPKSAQFYKVSFLIWLLYKSIVIVTNVVIGGFSRED